MEEKEFDDLWQQVLLVSSSPEMRKRHPDWRWGQTVFNVAYFEFRIPGIDKHIRGSKFDPFNDDSKVEAMHDKLKEVLVK